jgi:hypothetical protein
MVRFLLGALLSRVGSPGDRLEGQLLVARARKQASPDLAAWMDHVDMALLALASPGA